MGVQLLAAQLLHNASAQPSDNRIDYLTHLLVPTFVWNFEVAGFKTCPQRSKGFMVGNLILNQLTQIALGRATIEGVLLATYSGIKGHLLCPPT